MITLSKKMREEKEKRNGKTSRFRSVRDILLTKEVPEMEENLPDGCKVLFEDPNTLHEFDLTVKPAVDSGSVPCSYHNSNHKYSNETLTAKLKKSYLEEGFWSGGTFTFHITVPEEYNIKPPLACCKTKIWHPNINETGQICLSMLREHTIDGSGWAPTRKLKDLVWGLNSLFTDLLDFEDALNTEAAEQHRRSEEQFKDTVKLYIYNYAL